MAKKNTTKKAEGKATETAKKPTPKGKPKKITLAPGVYTIVCTGEGGDGLPKGKEIRVSNVVAEMLHHKGYATVKD
jgi:hypothetical protein